jgi:hypothetical protein
MTFDATPVQDPGPSNATFGAGDVLVGGGNLWRMGAAVKTNASGTWVGFFDEATNAAAAIVPAGSDAWQGGNALKSSANARSGYKLGGNSGQIMVGYSNPSHKRGWTYEILAKFTLNPPTYRVTINQDGWQAYPALQVKRTNSTALVVNAGGWFGTGGVWIDAETGGLPILDGKWHHIASTFESTGADSATMRVHVDGVEQAINTNFTLRGGNYYLNANGVAANAAQYQHIEVVNGLWVDAVALSDTNLTAGTFILPTAPKARGTIVFIK